MLNAHQNLARVRARRTLSRLLVAIPLAMVPITILAPLARVSGHASRRTPIALMAGRPIYLSDLPSRAQQMTVQVHYQEYQIEEQALDQLIDQNLLKDQAEQERLSVSELLAKHTRAPARPSDEALQNFYQAHRQQFTGAFEAQRTRVEASFKASQVAEASKAYVERLRSHVPVVDLILPPHVNIHPDWSRLRGNSGAPVMIVEFADFQCPYCRREEPVLRSLLATFKGRVSLSFRDFPLIGIHPQAEPAAEAARCAGEQGKFWQYHDILFREHAKLDTETLRADAAALGLNTQQFNACLSSRKYARRIEEDIAYAERSGVSGTPTFFINGHFLPGAQSRSELERVTNVLLSESRGKQ